MHWIIALLLWLPILPSHARAQVLDEIVIGRNAQAFHGNIQGRIRTFQSDAEATDVVRSIMTSMGLPLRFEVRAGTVDNASAILTDKGQRLIIYSTIFMEQIKKKTNEYWSLISIMAHEIGHHLCFHLAEQIDDDTAELEADYFSGFVLGKLGAELDQALAAMRELGTPLPTKTHPKGADRMEAIAAGWKNAKSNVPPDPRFGRLAEAKRAAEEAKAKGDGGGSDGRSPHWEFVRIDDCGGADDNEPSRGAEPRPEKCTEYDITAVCWDGKHFINGSGAWCTYKLVPPSACTEGSRRGRVYRCVF